MHILAEANIGLKTTNKNEPIREQDKQIYIKQVMINKWFYFSYLENIVEM